MGNHHLLEVAAVHVVVVVFVLWIAFAQQAGKANGDHGAETPTPPQSALPGTPCPAGTSHRILQGGCAQGCHPQIEPQSFRPTPAGSPVTQLHCNSSLDCGGGRCTDDRYCLCEAHYGQNESDPYRKCIPCDNESYSIFLIMAGGWTCSPRAAFDGMPCNSWLDCGNGSGYCIAGPAGGDKGACTSITPIDHATLIDELGNPVECQFPIQ